MNTALRRIAGLAAGCATAVALVAAAALAARTLWPGYAAAELERAFTLGMLVARLTAGACFVCAAALVTTIVARDDGKAAWWLGGIFLAISLPIHLYREWADFPVWYHAIYLAYLVPIAGLTGRFVRTRQPSLNR